MTLILKALSLLVLLFSPLLAMGQIDDDYRAQLQADSRRLHLADQAEWRKLLHYAPKLLGSGYEGQIDSPAFYLAAQGKTDAQAELDATLAHFFDDTPETNEVQNPQCAFIARYSWLNSVLKFDPARMTPRSCPRYAQWHETLNPAGLTMVFAAAYLNSPSSMYGHTLLRVDAKDQDEQTRLLAYSVSFAANTNETNGLAFALNGLFGGYPGTYSILPYYAKVREYSDFENRDLWEYQLRLSQQEVDRVLMHAWEMGPQYFDYFFFDENCAYHLLGLLQVARPEFEFTQSFPLSAIPSDTVSVISAYHGLVERKVYRPSSATLLHQRLLGMSSVQRALVHDISLGYSAVSEAAQLPTLDAAAVLETSLDYVTYRAVTGNKDVADSAALTHQLQQARSRIDYISPPLQVRTPKASPDQGHRSSRAMLGVGRRGNQNYQELQLRGTYHDLMDDDAAYVRGAEIEFFSMAMRHYDKSPIRLERFTPVSILSLAPHDEFFHSTSWKVSAGWQRTRAVRGSEPLALSIDGGMGAAWSDSADCALSYAFIESSVRSNSALRSGYALGMGGSTGSYLDVNERWRAHPYVKAIRYFSGQTDTALSMGLEQRITLGRDVAVRADVMRIRELQQTSNAGNLSLMVYF